MKIVDLQVIPFRVPRRPYRHGRFLDEEYVTQTLIKGKPLTLPIN